MPLGLVTLHFFTMLIVPVALLTWCLARQSQNAYTQLWIHIHQRSAGREEKPSYVHISGSTARTYLQNGYFLVQIVSTIWPPKDLFIEKCLCSKDIGTLSFSNFTSSIRTSGASLGILIDYSKLPFWLSIITFTQRTIVKSRTFSKSMGVVAPFTQFKCSNKDPRVDKW